MGSKVHQFGGPDRTFEKLEVWHAQPSRFLKISREDGKRRELTRHHPYWESKYE